ncbi:hypothetical protein BDN72DRAFT_860409 [Pluteus cervinus]|uniref:Uncharacterized protein n=1 Tax=Pluteus cervinus TaxID=181527 RepID=A0ACD3AJ03_9AGAR|nr:hypothetical protein BDN72DRAFT_860409 [Pluteus cervinus]
MHAGPATTTVKMLSYRWTLPPGFLINKIPTRRSDVKLTKALDVKKRKGSLLSGHPPGEEDKTEPLLCKIKGIVDSSELECGLDAKPYESQPQAYFGFLLRRNQDKKDCDTFDNFITGADATLWAPPFYAALYSFIEKMDGVTYLRFGKKKKDASGNAIPPFVFRGKHMHTAVPVETSNDALRNAEVEVFFHLHLLGAHGDFYIVGEMTNSDRPIPPMETKDTIRVTSDWTA